MDLSRVYDDNYRRLFRYCHRLTGDADVAEDVTQEAFVRLWDRDVQGEPPQLRSWLFRVATHLIRDRVKIRDNRRRLLEAYPVRPSGTEAPDRRLERRQDEDRVRDVLDRLDPRDKEMLLMRQEGFSYREIASAVDVAPGSVGTLLARALRRFAKEYQARNDVDRAS